MSDEKVLAWHFVGKTLRNGAPIPEIGETLEVKPPIKICKNGLHGSKKILDALKYAPGTMCCRVEIWGEIKNEDDKLAGLKRKILWKIDIKDILLEFSRECALDVIHLWDAPDVVKEFLKTGNVKLALAARAAADAAGAVGAARAAADAADAAADAAAAAGAVADAARAAARATNVDKYNKKLESIVIKTAEQNK